VRGWWCKSTGLLGPARWSAEIVESDVDFSGELPACHAGAVANAWTDFSPVVGVGLCQTSAKFSYTLRWPDGESLEQQSSIWGQEFEYLQARHLQITPSPPKSANSSIEPVKLSN
jgi:hypothetical protein